MDSQALARAYIECFCRADIEGLASLLSEDFNLSGPLNVFSTRSAYLASLQGNLEADPEAEIISVVSNGQEAAACYVYKGNTIGQFFKCRNHEIHACRLVFDTARLEAR